MKTHLLSIFFSALLLSNCAYGMHGVSDAQITYLNYIKQAIHAKSEQEYNKIREKANAYASKHGLDRKNTQMIAPWKEYLQFKKQWNLG